MLCEEVKGFIAACERIHGFLALGKALTEDERDVIDVAAVEVLAELRREKERSTSTLV